MIVITFKVDNSRSASIKLDNADLVAVIQSQLHDAYSCDLFKTLKLSRSNTNLNSLALSSCICSVGYREVAIEDFNYFTCSHGFLEFWLHLNTLYRTLDR